MIRIPVGLSSASLDELSGAAGPGYARDSARVGLVHLGLGAFARAHLAVYCDRLLAAGHLDVGICGVSLQSHRTVDALQEQDGLYTLVERDGDRADLRVVGSVLQALHGPVAAIAAVAAPGVRAVTLTVTEKGYGHCPGTTDLDVDRADVAHDRDDPAAPITAPGVLVAGLDRRRRAGLAPPVVISCDNLPGNGALLKQVVLALAGRNDPSLARWIGDEVAFPSTVVDRMVPEATDEDRDLVRERTGLGDVVPVRAEPYLQWVIQEVPGLLPWSEVGATTVGDVGPWECLKLGLLNGPHSALAYLGLLAGLTTISEAVADPSLARFVTALVEQEVIPSLPPVATDPVGYARACRGRFANTALGHRTAQVAVDGSQKLPPRILAPARAALEQGSGVDRLGLVVAAWMHHVARSVDEGRPVDDPLAAVFVDRLASARRSGPSTIDALVGISELFPSDLAARPAFRAAVDRGFGLIEQRGAVGAAAALA